MSKYALDLTQNAWKRQHGDITVYGTWYGEHLKPCIVLVPAHRQIVKPCVVLLDNAWMWSEEIGEPGHCARTAMVFAEYLGLDHLSAMTVQRIASIIRDSLSDLIGIKPKPTDNIVVADALWTDTDGKRRHAEVTERV